MKSIKSKLLVSIGTIVLIFSAILLHRTYRMVRLNIENLTNQQLSLALNFDLAIRDYVAKRVRPVMFDLVPEGEFMPETMSTSFVARNIFEKVRENFPEYIIKFSADNPRNPVNQAGPEELAMIEHFNNNPGDTVWTGEVTLHGKPYFAKFSAMRMEDSCLRCHGDPADAPAELVKKYGATASFHLPLGKVIGMDTIAIPSTVVTHKLVGETIQNFAVMGSGLFLLCVSLFFVFKFVITERLSKITAHFVHTEGKDEDEEIKDIEIGGNDEISTLTKSFNKLARKLNNSYRDLMQTKETLRQNEEKYRLLAENISDVIWIMDLKSFKFTYVSPSSYQQRGYTSEETMRLPLKETLAPDSLEFAQKVIAEELAIDAHSNPKRSRTIELEHYCKDGSTRWVEITSKFLRDENGIPHAILGASRDINDRKHAEAQIKTALREKEVLLREIHHRVKNNFEIVASLLDLSSFHTNDRKIQNLWAAAHTRIHSMALIHAQLYENDRYDKINMEQHIRKLADHISQLYSEPGKRIHPIIEPSEVYLSVNQAIPCALVLNELITNAYKHAFINRVEGSIRISIDSPTDGTVRISVRDDGNGIPEGLDPDNAKGLGFKLTRHLVNGQLKGKMNFFNNDGTEVGIEFKTL
ncbi:MAG: DUF3365 domain-containing protein [Pseudomonadota bacterium]